jgi:hypothetical protein
MDNCCDRCCSCDGYRNSDKCNEHYNHPFCSCNDKCKDCGEYLVKGFCHNCTLQLQPNTENEYLKKVYEMISEIQTFILSHDVTNAQLQVDVLKTILEDEMKCYCGEIH